MSSISQTLYLPENLLSMPTSRFFSVAVISLIGLTCLNSLSAQPANENPSQRTAESLAAPKLPPFPKRGLLPKAETGALEFLKDHPEYDGRGTVVAIFDSGVDPGAPGLQSTSDGKVKIIDMIDGTGSGDVDTSTTRTAEEGMLAGLTGKQLKLSQDWLQGEGPHTFHVGIKAAYDFFPPGLIRRLREERGKEFQESQQQLENAVRQKILEWKATHPQPTAEEKREFADLEQRLEQLQAAGEAYHDPGPVFDCIVFAQDDTYYAVVDTDCDADLTDEKLLTNYRLKQEYGTFPQQLNFAVNIFENGRRLSLVTDSSPHGTHVAGIVAAHFPDKPEYNGIAPGAQIVSVKIGHPLLDGMETGAGLTRGFIRALEHKVDLINMSYGEETTAPNRGYLTGLCRELVNQHRVIYVSSAGNEGPALSTVTAPGGTTEAVLGIGAYLSPEMMKAEYALRESLPETAYTWTSRGPTFDAAPGVDLFAPGGAISPVPSWTLQSSMQMNGTSMASPNACGALAVLISALKASEIPYSPYSIRRALQNTARPINTVDPFAQGTGLIDLPAAFEALQQHQDLPGELLQFQVTSRAQPAGRGIVLRDVQATHPLETQIRVQAIFPENTPAEEKVAFELPITLQVDADWVKIGQHILLTSSRNSLDVAIHPEELTSGVHTTEILGYDTNHPERGPLFRFPIQVIKPELLDEKNEYQQSFTFEPGTIERTFFHVPEGATWAEVELSLSKSETPKRFVLHTVQPLEGEKFEDFGGRRYLRLSTEKPTNQSFPVEDGRSLELCLAQYWSSLGSSEVELKLHFHGIETEPDAITLTPGSPGESVEISAPLGPERLSISAKLDRLRQVLYPATKQLTPGSQQRDQWPSGRISYSLVLEYRFDLEKDQKVTLRFPHTEEMFYDSPLGGQLVLLFDEGKQLVAAEDMYPEPLDLKQGKYLLRLELRHHDPDVLERFTKFPLWKETSSPKPISLKCYRSRVDALSGENAVTSARLEQSQHLRLFLASPEMDAIPGSAGDVLVGRLHLTEDKYDRGIPLTYLVDTVKSPAEPGTPQESTSEPISEKALLEQQLAFRLEQLKKLPSPDQDELFEKLLQQILAAHPQHLPALVTKLHRLDDPKQRKQHLPEVIQAADAVIEQINTQQLSSVLGVRANEEDPASVSTRKQQEKLLETLIDALYRKGRALAYRELPDVVAKHPIEDQAAHDAAFEANFVELARWVDTTEEEYFLLHIRRERRLGRRGNCLKWLNHYIPQAEPTYFYYKKRRDLYQELGWQHLYEYERDWLLRRFPQAYQPF